MERGKGEGMLIEIDFNSPEAIYIQLRNQIVMEIAQERLRDGDSLPSVRSLAKELGVNMHTVNKAYAILREEGYLKLDRRKGAIVSVEKSRKEDELEKINNYMQMIVAQAICKEITKEEMSQIVAKCTMRFVCCEKDFRRRRITIRRAGQSHR